MEMIDKVLKFLLEKISTGSGLLIWFNNDETGMEEQDLSSFSSTVPSYLVFLSSFKMFTSVYLVGVGHMCVCQRTMCDRKLELSPRGLVMRS